MKNWEQPSHPNPQQKHKKNKKTTQPKNNTQQKTPNEQVGGERRREVARNFFQATEEREDRVKITARMNRRESPFRAVHWDSPEKRRIKKKNRGKTGSSSLNAIGGTTDEKSRGLKKGKLRMGKMF